MIMKYEYVVYQFYQFHLSMYSTLLKVNVTLIANFYLFFAVFESVGTKNEANKRIYDSINR